MEWVIIAYQKILKYSKSIRSRILAPAIEVDEVLWRGYVVYEERKRNRRLNKRVTEFFFICIAKDGHH
jgi:hypothetical protein